MERIYLDNAATSFPKPPEVAAGMLDYIQNNGCNVNRGGYAAAYGAAETVLDTRERLCELFGFKNPHGVIFTANVTTSLNVILKGLLRAGDHVLVTAMEHNAVMRPLTQLTSLGVSFDRVPCDRDGRLLLDRLEPMLRENTRAVVMTHASNVSGTLMPVEQVGEICRRRGASLIVDCAQTAGSVKIDMEKMKIDALAFTAHKGLLAPQGLGGFLVPDRLAEKISPLIAGGTGSFSHLESMPEQLPDRFEPGTPNLPGIYGLAAALGYIKKRGIKNIRAHEQDMLERLTAGLRGDERLRIVGPTSVGEKTGVLSLDFVGRDNAEIAYALDSEFGIMTRCGLHCAPNAHKTLGTYPQGTVRFSVGAFTTAAEVDYAVQSIGKLL